MHSIKDAVMGAIGTGAAVLGVIGATEDWLRVIAAIGACVVPVVTVWSIVSRGVRQKELDRLLAIKDAQTICHVCRMDCEPPAKCPYPDDELPAGCLKLKPKEKT